jgi:DNA-binding transcriptional LysR family regulator
LLPDLLAGLRRGALDAVVANCPHDSVADDAFGLETLFRQRLIIVAGPTFAIASSWAALSRAPWIIPPTPGGPLRRALDARFVALGFPPPRSAFAVPNMIAALQMVHVGLGLSVVPEIVMSAAAARGQVRRIAIKPAIELPPTCLLYRRAAAQHPRTRAIADAVRTAANDMIARDKSLRRLS